MHYRAKKFSLQCFSQHIGGYNTQKSNLKGKNAKHQYLFVFKKIESK